MFKYRYIAYDNFGKKQSGYVEADSKDAAVAQVKNQGLQPTALYGPYGRQPGAGGINISRVRMKSLAAYTRKFSQLYKAGVGMDEIFTILGDEEESRLLRNVSKELAADINNGMNIEDALRKYPLIFPPLFSALFKAGMDGGTLDDVADRLATLYEKESELRTQMWTKLVYPITLLVIAILASIFLTRFVPFFPRELATGIITFWAIVVGLIIFFCTPVGYPILRSVLLFTPYIGQLMRKTNLSRFCRILGLLYNSGVPLLESLDLSKQTLQDPRLSNSINRVKDYVNQGDNLATAMKKAGMISQRVISMVAVGERGGSVDEMLKKMSAYYDIEIEHQQQVLLVAAYFVAYLLVAITIGIIVISFWVGYWRFALSAGEW
jgi:type IV pilus assembly protein PilC